jgi:hypothetical protein
MLFAVSSHEWKIWSQMLLGVWAFIRDFPHATGGEFGDAVDLGPGG